MPRWVKRSPDGKLVLIPERAAVIKRIFRLTASGYGLSSLVGLLTREGVPAFGAGVALNGTDAISQGSCATVGRLANYNRVGPEKRRTALRFQVISPSW